MRKPAKTSNLGEEWRRRLPAIPLGRCPMSD
jgi:hypothetical protein